MPDAQRTVPMLQPVSGLQVRQDQPAAYVDPVKAAVDAAARAKYTLLAKNRRDVEKIVTAVLSAWTSHGECTVTYEHVVKHIAAPTQGDWTQAYAVFAAKLLQAGLGPVTAPYTETRQHPQHGRTIIRFQVRAVPLRPPDTLEARAARAAAAASPVTAAS